MNNTNKSICEICQRPDLSLIKTTRIWHDGTVDNMLVCTECGQDDPDGAWKYAK